MRILIQWEDVPLELQQSNGIHRLRTSGGLQVAAPEVITKLKVMKSSPITAGEHSNLATMSSV